MTPPGHLQPPVALTLIAEGAKPGAAESRAQMDE